MNIKKGDKIKVIDNGAIELGDDLTNGSEYEVKVLLSDGSILVRDDANHLMLITIEEMQTAITTVAVNPTTELIGLLRKAFEDIVKGYEKTGRNDDEKAERNGDEKTGRNDDEIKIDLKNLARKSVIADAEKFLETHLKPNCYVKGKPAVSFRTILGVKPEFIVNEEKRTVTVLMRGAGDGLIFKREVARCNPDDVFNATIGKAIALGRAFNLNVEKFINAAQPNEVAVGQGFKVTGYGHVSGKTGKVTKMAPSLDGLFGTAFYHSIDDGWLGANQVKISNDTEAVYE